jgi:aspartate aminotransferase
MVAEFRSRRDIVHSLLGELRGLRPALPEGAMFFFLNTGGFLGRTGGGKVMNDDGDLAAHLLHDHHVAIVPGSAFGEPGHLRVSFSSPEPLLREGIKRLILGLGDLH